MLQLLDSGTELTSTTALKWTTVPLTSSQGKPMQNAFIESFNSSCRNECLNEHMFRGLAEARQIINVWRHDSQQVAAEDTYCDCRASTNARRFTPALKPANPDAQRVCRAASHNMRASGV
jgi:transposase InsO family protein